MDTRHIQIVLTNGAKCRERLLADVRRQLQGPPCIVVTAMRPDMLYSECERTVYFIELMIPFANEEGFES